METVASADGTTIAFERVGAGPALILVVGAFCDRTVTRSLAATLAPNFTVYSYDRRGRGSSGDTAPYAVDREIEDIDALISEVGGSALVFGHSSGAALALEAAARGLAITRLAAYEPPYIVDATRPRPPADLADRLSELLSAGRRGDAAEYFLREAVNTPPDAVAAMRAAPTWPGFEKLAHTLRYDVIIMDGNDIPASRMARIRIPTLLLDGGASPDWARNSVAALAGIIPGARHLTLDGQTHGAADEVLSPVLVDFLT